MKRTFEQRPLEPHRSPRPGEDINEWYEEGMRHADEWLAEERRRLAEWDKSERAMIKRKFRPIWIGLGLLWAISAVMALVSCSMEVSIRSKPSTTTEAPQ